MCSHLEVFNKVQDRHNRKTRRKWEKDFVNTPGEDNCGRANAEEWWNHGVPITQDPFRQGNQRISLFHFALAKATVMDISWQCLIHQENKEKRLRWAREYLNESEDGFDNVIWTDESSIQCETHKHFCYRKKNCPPKRKPRCVTWMLYIYSSKIGRCCSICMYECTYISRQHLMGAGRGILPTYSGSCLF